MSVSQCISHRYAQHRPNETSRTNVLAIRILPSALFSSSPLTLQRPHLWRVSLRTWLRVQCMNLCAGQRSAHHAQHASNAITVKRRDVLSVGSPRVGGVCKVLCLVGSHHSTEIKQRIQLFKERRGGSQHLVVESVVTLSLSMGRRRIMRRRKTGVICIKVKLVCVSECVCVCVCVWWWW
jgi:hypothetical protein